MPTATQSRNGKPSLDGQLKEIEREYGAGTVIRLGERRVRRDVEAIPTGALSLDIALGIGGVPRGRIVELYGPESSGKTTLAYHILAEAQRLGGTCAFIDAEHAMDASYAARIGVDVEQLLVCQPDWGEQALQVADMLVRSHELAVVVVDSVAALTPRAEIEGQIGDQSVGLMARMMSQALRKLAGDLQRAGTLCVFVNQLREKVGVVYGSPEVTPGGRALKFYASMRLEVRRVETLKDGGVPIGNRVKVKVAKNKVAPPFREAEFDLEFGTGISTLGCIADAGVANGAILRSGSHFTYGETKLGQGRQNVKAYLGEHPEVATAIESEVREAVGLRHPQIGADAGARSNSKAEREPENNSETGPAEGSGADQLADPTTPSLHLA
jgi:recombination protein RecA